jgi:nicotinamide riboside transporter PnuC
MRRDHILMIWIGGIVLAVALYLIGPDRFFDTFFGLLDAIDAAFRNLLAELGVRTYSVVRALAIAIYVVFAVLAVLASQRGHRGFWALVVVSGVFMMLIWRPFGVYPAPLSRWMAALVLVVVAAVVMTQRLTVPPARRNGPLPPYPPGPAR